VFTADIIVIPLITELQFSTMTLRTVNEHYCWLHVKCLTMHFISVLLNVKLTNTPDDRVQQFM